MHAAQGTPQDLRSVVTLVVIIATLGVVYWRTALRIILIIGIALTAYGAVLVLDGLHHVAR